MTAPCTHPRTGSVTSRTPGTTDGEYAHTRVCDRVECVTEATVWVARHSYGKPVYHARDEVSAS